MKDKLTISISRKFIRKLISGILFYSSLLFLIILFLLQLSAVQTRLADMVLEKVSEQTDFQISLEKVKITWLDEVSLEGLLVLDTQEDSMLYADRLSLNYEILDLVQQDYLAIEEVSSDHLLVNLVRYDSLSKMNLSQFLESLSSGPKEQKKSKAISIDKIDLSQSLVKLTDKTKDTDLSKVDFNHLDFDLPEIQLKFFSIKGDTIAGILDQFAGKDLRSGFTIQKFQTSFLFSNYALSLDDLDLRTPTSNVSDSLEFYYNGLDDFGAFADSVSFVFHFLNSRISSEDIGLFTGTDEVKSDISLDGIFWGSVGDFNIEQARIGIGDSTYIEGGLSCFGLPELEKTFILADINKSHLIPTDLQPYIGSVSENMRRMGKIDFTGSFAGFLNDFVAKGDFYTNQGSVHSDINLKIPKDPKKMAYRGNLELIDLNIGAFLENNLIQKVNLIASVNGSGITQENADFSLEATILNSSLYNYAYDSIYLNGKFQNNFFNGRVDVGDPNCLLQGMVELDMRNSRELADIDIFIDDFVADSLNLTNDGLSLEGHIDLQVNSFDFDKMEGSIKVDSGLVTIEDKHILLDSILIASSFMDDSSRHIQVDAPGIKSEINGHYLISDLIRDIPILIDGFANQLHLKDTLGADSSFVYMQNSHSELSGTVELKNASPYFDSLGIPLAVSRGSLIEFDYRNSKSTNFSMYFEADSLSLLGTDFIGTVFEMNGSTDGNLESVLTNFLFESSDQLIQDIPDTRSVLVEGVWYGNVIDFSTQVEQVSSASKVRLESQLSLWPDSVVYRVLPSDILILDDQWNFNPTNRIIIMADEVLFENMELYDQSESIRLAGVMSERDSSYLDIIVEELNMDKVNLFTDKEVKGFANSNFKIFKAVDERSFRFDGDFFVKRLVYDNVTIGDVSGFSNWDSSDQSIFSRMEVVNDDFKSIEVSGHYLPSEEVNQLDFNVLFDKADLIMARPFVQESFSDLRGTATGLVHLKGNLNHPNLDGDFTIDDGGGTVQYLNTEYTFDGQVVFDSDVIELRQLDLRDRKGASASLGGSITHRSFSDFQTDFTLTANNFEFLNTSSLDNSLYYGSAYGSGEIKISGPLDDLFIKANVRTDPNTRLFIPVSESTNASQEDFVQFVNFSDSSQNVDQDSKSVIKGLTMDFDIAVTNDAYCELIFDIKKGDIIRGRGQGNLKLLLNTDGEFRMFGPLEISDGAYNFTLSNLINKEFDVVPGSRIVWYGDPYDANLALEATYLQRASFEELESVNQRNESDLANKLPVLAVLNMQGSMLSPVIDFDIRLQNEGDANNEIVGSLSRIRNDEQELRRQFISLLFLRRFSPYESFSLGSGDGIGGSVSEILSNQVSYLVSQIDENLEIEVDLASLDEQAFNTFQLRFAYTLLDGRLRVSRQGGFGGNVQENQNAINSIIGDWSVEYSLTSDGRLRAKVFQNSNSQLVNPNGGSFSQETGISLRFVHSFNDLRELLISTRKEGILRRKEEELVNTKNSNGN